MEGLSNQNHIWDRQLKKIGIMRREFSLGVKNTDGPFVYRNFGGTWPIFFRFL